MMNQDIGRIELRLPRSSCDPSDPKKFVRTLYPEMWWQEAGRVRGEEKYGYKDVFKIGNVCGFHAKEFGTDLLVSVVVDVTNLAAREHEIHRQNELLHEGPEPAERTDILGDIEFFLKGDPTCTLVHTHKNKKGQLTMQVNWKWEIADVEKPEGG